MLTSAKLPSAKRTLLSLFLVICFWGLRLVCLSGAGPNINNLQLLATAIQHVSPSKFHLNAPYNDNDNNNNNNENNRATASLT